MRAAKRVHSGAQTRRSPENLRGVRVLHVDDSPAVLEAVALRLAPQGIRLTSTTDPREALRLLTAGRRTRVDLLIVDLVMPGLDGIGVINAALAAHRLPRTLVLSGSQGSHQTAQSLHELGSPTWAGMCLPIRYLKKLADGFDDALSHHLRALRSTPLRHRAHIRDAVLPQLRSVIEPREAGPEIPTEVRRRRIFEGMLDRYLDLRFTILLDADPFVEGLAATVASLGDERRTSLTTTIQAAWRRGPRPRREEILLFDQIGWHNFKSDALLFRDLLSVFINRLLDHPALHAERERATALMARWEALATLGVSLCELRKVGRSPERCDVLAALRAEVQDANEGHSVVPIRRDIPDGTLELALPAGYAYSITHQLLLNAREAMQSAGILGEDAPMLLRSRMVPREDWTSAMQVVPHPTDALGARYRPPLSATRYWYFGVLNPGAPIAPTVRETMLAGTGQTTKEFGSGMGMTFIHALCREVPGAWLEVQSRDGWTEIGVYTPIPEED